MTFRTMLQAPGRKFSERARAKRRLVFLEHVEITPETRILDLGGGNGWHMKCLLEGTKANPANVTVADVDGTDAVGGFTKVHLRNGLLQLPFPDKAFDVVFCNSVIEHVTNSVQNNRDVWNLRNPAFKSEACARQAAFAKEVQRIGRTWWVQTPNKWFIMEAHAWAPFVGWLPRNTQLAVLKVLYKAWISSHNPDWHLLTERDMRRLFPKSRILREKSLGHTKSLTAFGAPDSV